MYLPTQMLISARQPQLKANSGYLFSRAEKAHDLPAGKNYKTRIQSYFAPRVSSKLLTIYNTVILVRNVIKFLDRKARTFENLSPKTL